MLAPSTTVKDILLYKKVSLILTCMSTELFLKKNNRIFKEVIFLKLSEKYKFKKSTNNSDQSPNSEFILLIYFFDSQKL